MGISPVARATEVILGGAALTIPGVSGVVTHLGRPVFIHHFGGKLDLVSQVTEQGAILVPFRARVLDIRSRVRTQCGTGSGIASVGKVGSAAYFTTLTHTTAMAAGVIVVGTLAEAIIAANDVVYASGDGGATTNGDCDVWMAYTPEPA